MRSESAGLVLRGVQLTAWGGFIYLWIRLSLKDWKDQKILHRDMLAATGFVAAAYALLLLSTLLGVLGWTSIYYRWEFYRDLLAHMLLSCAAAMGLWAGRVWPAGDAKLFMFLAALLPLLSVAGSFERGGLFFMALVNVFLPACAFVFAQVVRYLWLTRFQHTVAHLSAMGPRRAADFAFERLRPALISAWGIARTDLAILLRPRDLLSGAFSWVVAFGLMAALSVTLKDLIASSSVRTLLSFVLMIGWGRLGGVLGGRATAGAVAVVAALVALKGAPWRSEFLHAMGHISIFGLFIMLGMRWTLGAASGQVLMLILPLLMALLGGMIRLITSTLGLFPGAAQRLFGSDWLRELLPLAVMGLFFGLCYVLVRIWEDEDRPEIPIEKVLSYMVLHPSFLEQIEREAPDFYEEHFASRYADGLSEEQAKALRKLCLDRGWKTVWLQNTMSFAHWIFLGYFLTWLMRGHLLERWL